MYQFPRRCNAQKVYYFAENTSMNFNGLQLWVAVGKHGIKLHNVNFGIGNDQQLHNLAGFCTSSYVSSYMLAINLGTK